MHGVKNQIFEGNLLSDKIKTFRCIKNIKIAVLEVTYSKIIKYYMRFVINNICNDGKNLTHTIHT